MKTIKEKKTFDAVAASRRWKQAVAAEIAGMTSSEKVAYFRSHSQIQALAEAKPKRQNRKLNE